MQVILFLFRLVQAPCDSLSHFFQGRCSSPSHILNVKGRDRDSNDMARNFGYYRSL
jgi:hypothetical protein